MTLENLKKQAKTLRRNWRLAKPEILARIRAAHPQYAALSDPQLAAVKPRLTDCQLVLAREAGFESWPAMRAVLLSSQQQQADQFVDLACLCYDDPHYDHRSFHARAHAVLAADADLAGAHIWAAAAAGNARAVASFLEDEPELINRPGPHGWSPLFCAVYSRVKPIQAGDSTFDVARLLLDRGADANAYTLKRNDPPGSSDARKFTVLTGVFGGGSTGPANQPPHPQWRALAELLLARGADPSDKEALRINQDASLELLLHHGLKKELLGRELSIAARYGRVERVRLLLSYAARTDEKFDGRTSWEWAMSQGHREIGRMLEEAGSPVSELDDGERFTSSCMAGDEAGARAMLKAAPDLLARAPQSMVLKASGTGRKEAVNLVLDLGFDPDFVDEVVALHGARDQIVRLLLDRGASPAVREPFYDATPVGWADFFEATERRNMLLNEGAICLFDALDYDRLDRVPDILVRDPDALNRPFAKCLTREPSPGDWQTPLVRMVERGKADAARVLLEHGADVTARHPDGRSLVQLARDREQPDIVELLTRYGGRE